jgi:hypothetical protein
LSAKQAQPGSPGAGASRLDPVGSLHVKRGMTGCSDRDLFTLRDELFAREYLRDLDAPAAYLRVHPTAKPATARREGLRTLAMARIADRIAALRTTSASESEVPSEPRTLQPLRTARFRPAYWRLPCPACHKPAERAACAPTTAIAIGHAAVDPSMEPAPDCVECHGTGIGATVVVDLVNGRAEHVPRPTPGGRTANGGAP